MVRTLLAALALALLPASALAAGKPASDAAAAEAPDGRVMTTDNLVLPVVQDGRLINYLFVNVRVELSGQGDTLRLKERSHFLRDAFIRAGHRTSLAQAAKPDTLDEAAAQRTLFAAAEEALGKGAVRRLSFEQIGALSAAQRASRR